MPRTLSLSLAIYCLAALLHACSNPGTPTDTDSNTIVERFKNVVFIVSDDHSYTTVGAYGNPIINTPNLDRLAAAGTMFTRAYSNSPICSASRQSMLTAKRPHASGVSLLFTPFPDAGNVTVAEHLQTFGFSTALIGKTHWNHFVWYDLYQGDFPTHGFDTVMEKGVYKNWLQANPPQAVPDSIMTREKGKGDRSTQWIKNADALPVGVYEANSEAAFFAEEANKFISKHKDGRFCLWLAFHQPHAPFYFPIEYAGKYPPDSVPLPQGSPEDDRWVPAMFRDLTEAERRGIISAYYSSVEYMDAQVGKVVAELERQGIADSTLIVYVGDQGYLLNDHKRFEKHTFWEESVRAPLIVAGGNQLQQGKSTAALVEFIDIVPTVVDLLGLPQHPDFQGQSFADVLLKADEQQHREYVFSEFLHDNMAMVATDEWKYTFTSGKRDLDLGYATGHGPSGIYHRLHKLSEDPKETTNLAYKTEYREKMEEMQQKLLEAFEATHPEAERCPAELNTIGKLVWYCEPRDVGGEYTDKPARVFMKEEYRIEGTER